WVGKVEGGGGGGGGGRDGGGGGRRGRHWSTTAARSRALQRSLAGSRRGQSLYRRAKRSHRCRARAAADRDGSRRKERRAAGAPSSLVSCGNPETGRGAQRTPLSPRACFF